MLEVIFKLGTPILGLGYGYYVGDSLSTNKSIFYVLIYRGEHTWSLRICKIIYQNLKTAKKKKKKNICKISIITWKRTFWFPSSISYSGKYHFSQRKHSIYRSIISFVSSILHRVCSLDCWITAPINCP